MRARGQDTVLIAGSGRAGADASAGLLQSGYRVDCVEDPALALDRLLVNGFALVLVASLRSERTGGRLALCAAIRERCGALPILLLGAAEPEREAIGRPGGPDDYVVREFDLAEIRTRVRLSIDRARDRNARARAGTLLSCGPLRLDPGTRRVSHGVRSTQLTAIEYQLLCHLARSPGPLARADLLRDVWGYEHDGYAQVLTTHVNRLRAKLERELGAPRLVETVRGLGYRFAVEDDR